MSAALQNSSAWSCSKHFWTSARILSTTTNIITSTYREPVIRRTAILWFPAYAGSEENAVFDTVNQVFFVLATGLARYFSRRVNIPDCELDGARTFHSADWVLAHALFACPHNRKDSPAWLYFTTELFQCTISHHSNSAFYLLASRRMDQSTR